MSTKNTTAKAVDLGLSVKWASCNIKSAKDSTKDAFFAWGCTEEQSVYIASTYSYYQQDITDNTGYLRLNKDAAVKNWGDKWRIPSAEEWEELITKCTWIKTTQDGVEGYNVSGNGNTIFLPLNGLFYGDEGYYAGTAALYWTSKCSIIESDKYIYAYAGYINDYTEPFYCVSDKKERCIGGLIRPIYDESLPSVTPDTDDDTDTGAADTNAVDLGLSVKWARWNIGAYSEDEYGSLIAWGDPTGKNTSFVNSDYPNPSSGDIAGTEYDTATALWGEGWKMPTAAEWAELDSLTKEIITLSNGIKVFKVTAANGNYIYLPKGGYETKNGLQEQNVSADYWTSGCTSQTWAVGVRIGKVSSTFEDQDQKGWHMLIRPVYKKSGSSGNTDSTLTDEGKKAMAVDLGLSVKWATYNLGASGSTDPGSYFSWAETTPKANFSNFSNVDFTKKNYKWYDASTGKFSIPGTNISHKTNDAATQLWGGTWRMPTQAEMDELVKQCTWIKEDYGFRIKGPSGNEIFLPTTGFFSGIDLSSTSKCYYWSASYNDLPLHAEDYWAYYLTNYTSNSETLPTVMSTYVYNGLCIRPVSGGDIDTDPDTPDPDPTPTPTPTPDPDTPDDDTPDDDKDDVSSNALTITDTYSEGYSIDPNVILYAGGQEVIPQTMTQKDNTLFLGNFKESNKVFSQNMLDFIKSCSSVEYKPSDTFISKGESGSLYMYENQLGKSSYDITFFKGGEAYRFGLVFQDTRGEWSDVVYVGDYVNNKIYPSDNGTSFRAAKAKIDLNSSAVNKVYEMGYRKAKAVVVYPSINNRLVVCQGVMCPTVYNINQRKNNSPYAMSSWFFREIHSKNSIGTQNMHNCNIYNDIIDYVQKGDRVLTKTPTVYFGGPYDYSNQFHSITQFRAEISCADVVSTYAWRSIDNQNMYVDWNTVTMNTPEVDFSLQDSASTIPTENVKLRIIGIIPLTSNASDIYVYTDTQPIKVAAFTGLHNSNDNHNNISSSSNLRLTQFDWYDYDYHQHKTDNDWNVDKPYFETDDDYVTESIEDANSSFEAQAYKSHRAYPLYPWQGAKSLVGQFKTREESGILHSALKKKIISNIRTSAFTYYFPNNALSYSIGNVGIYSGDIPLTKLTSDANDTDHAGMFNYYGEVDTLIAPKEYYEIYQGPLLVYSLDKDNFVGFKDIAKVYPCGKTNDSVRMKYKSSPHLACHLNYTKEGKQELLPSFKLRSITFGDQLLTDYSWDSSGKYYIPGWSDKVSDKTKNAEHKTDTSLYHQSTIDLSYPILPLFSSTDYEKMGYMYIGEFYKDAPDDLSTLFGGKTSMAFEQNHWHTAGPTVSLVKNSVLTVDCLQGDTYYQRYDSMKTYPYSDDDPNQIVEILSFMCETRMNIDGRYDANRGMASNLYMNRVNFNLFNSAYTQQDNFFNYYFLAPEKNSDDTYPNGFLWTSTKTMGEEIDSWSKINTASSYTLDGDKGDLYALINWNDTLLSFQENGIARIMYNDRVQIATNDGSPIELANSGKVSGKQYMSNTVGCTNKRTIQITPKGLYFMDSNSKDLCVMGGNSVDSLSKSKGFNNYFYNKNINKFRTFYDEKSTDIYFIDDSDCLDFNESLNEFEGFYDYGGTDYMFNYSNSFMSVKNNSIWKQYAGDYNVFFNEYKPFWLTLVSNDGNNDKTFSNIEFEADSWHSDNTLADTTFDHLSIWDEYQVGESVLRSLNTNVHYHFSNLKRKFRIWRANIPRELKLKDITFPEALKKMEIGDVDENTGKILNMTEGLNRIRNTWAYIRLKKYKENTDKTTLHGIKTSFIV